MLVLMLNNLSSNPADVFFYYFSVKISKKSSRKTRVQVSVATVPKKVEATWTCLKKVKYDLPDWFHLLQEMETQTYLPTYHTSKLTTNLCRFIEWTCQSMQQSYQFIWCLWQFKESSSNFTNMVISVHSFWNAISIHGVIKVP